VIKDGGGGQRCAAFGDVLEEIPRHVEGVVEECTLSGGDHGRALVVADAVARRPVDRIIDDVVEFGQQRARGVPGVLGDERRPLRRRPPQRDRSATA
jgi:hypothetical protein